MCFHHLLHCNFSTESSPHSLSLLVSLNVLYAHYAKMVLDRNRALMIICCLSPAPRSLSMHLVHSSVLSSGFDSVCKRVLIIMITLIIYLFRHTLNTKLTHTRARLFASDKQRPLPTPSSSSSFCPHSCC